VLTCTLSNPPRQTLTGKGVRELLQLVDDVNADASIRLLVLIGEDPEVFITHCEVGELIAEANVAAASSHGDASTQPDDAEVKLHPFT
jgi:enoyl-CoA hydratase/carnithine racemase